MQALTAHYSADSTYAASVSGATTINVARAILQVTANNYVIPIGSVLPTYSATITGFVNGDTQGLCNDRRARAHQRCERVQRVRAISRLR